MFSLYIVAWIASITYAFEMVIGKLISKHSIKNPWLFNFLWELFILAGVTIVGLWFGIGIPTQWTYIIWGSLMYALAGSLYAFVLYKLDVSVLGPMFSFRTVMAVLIGAIFLGEVLTLHQYFLIGIIFIFGIFINFDEKFNLKSFFNKWIIVLFVDMLCIVFMSMFIKKAVMVNGFWDTTVWVAFLGQLWLLFTIKFFRQDLIQTSRKQYSYIALLSIAGIIGTLAANAAYAINVSLASVIISIPISMILAFIFSVFKPELLEKHTLKIYAIRFISAIVMIISALKL